MKRLRTAAYWLAPLLVCLALHWRGLLCWFSGDDFAWLSLHGGVHNFHDLLVALFRPEAQGTIRPLSERAPFLLSVHFFGLNALPLHAAMWAAHFANVALMMWISARLTGRKLPGLLAGILWNMHGALVFPLGWTCVFNQPLCGLFLFTAFAAMLKHEETGRRRWAALEWGAFLVAFGALELAVVYPALAAAYALLAARRRLLRTLPMFAVSAAYTVAHFHFAPVTTPVYAAHYNLGMLRTLWTYWNWSAGPSFAWTPYIAPDWLIPTGVALVTLALAAFVALRWRQRPLATLFPLAWFVITIGPMLPLRDHMTEYYVYLPLAGLSWLGGWAIGEAFRNGLAWKVPACLAVALYAGMTVPQAARNDVWFYDITQRVRWMVLGVEAAHQLHPGKAIMLDGVDSPQYWHGIRNLPFRVIGFEQVYLSPGSGRTLEYHPDAKPVTDFELPAEAVKRALDREELVVYDARGPILRAITSRYSPPAAERGAPRLLDAANPLLGYLLGPGWDRPDENHRWMGLRASLRMGGPTGEQQSLYLSGVCPDGNLAQGPLPVTVTVDGEALPVREIRPGEGAFNLAFPLPSSVVGKDAMQVEISIPRVAHVAGDDRDLGLAFGVLSVK